MIYGFKRLKCLFINFRRPTDDPEVKKLLKIDNDLIDKLGTGVFEDIIPYFKDIYPTKKWQMFLSMVDEMLTVLRRKFREHVETFQPGYNLYTVNPLPTPNPRKKPRKLIAFVYSEYQKWLDNNLISQIYYLYNTSSLAKGF